jgi:ABC-type lipoprotein export system ATPase subunit
MSTLVNIEQATCEYNSSENFRLNVEDISLKKGKVYFILGKSGSGKSTFLEAVGLMNNTFKSSYSNVWFGEETKNIEIPSLWNDKSELSAFRRKHLSFIFQSTNFMESFTVGENMCLPQLLDGVEINKAESKVKKLMSKLLLEEDVFHKQPNNLSGGQRQRAAFVRAITAPFQLILGDEPTGNLDEKTSNELMKILYQEISENDKTALIVSHNISQAMEYGDHILYVRKNDEGVNTVSNRYQLDRVQGTKDWTDQGGNIIDDIGSFLRKQIM